MNAKNLPLKFAVLAVVIALCLWSLHTRGCQQGIDLQGGHSLIFEIRTPQAEIEGLKDQVEQWKKERDKALVAKNEVEAKRLDDLIARTERDIQGKAYAGGERNLAERMIEILKERIDPQGLANLEWRPMGRDRIEVRMPAGREDTRQRRHAYEDARDRLDQSSISRTRRARYLAGTPQQRQELLKGLTERQQAALRTLGEAYDELRAAEQALQAARAEGQEAKTQAAQSAHDNARNTFRQKDLALDATNIRLARLDSILSNYRSPDEQATLKKEEIRQLQEVLARDLAALEAEHPDRKALIDEVVGRYKAWSRVRHRLSDPADLQRRIARSGVLEFRIVAGYYGVDINRKDQEFYKNLLEKDGPEEVRRRGLPFAWFPVRGNERKQLTGNIMAEYAGRSYILLCNQDENKMVRGRLGLEGGWRLADAFRDADNIGRLAIGFQFDQIGARKFYNLTSANKGRSMAILLDDEVFSAPRIKEAISDRGQITGNFSREDVEENVRLLQAGSLPARLNPQPVAVRSFGPTLGAENRARGIRTAYIGMVVVVAWMLLFYFLAGSIADVALLLNIILLLGAMSLLGAVFTLPGIAGVVLTIGMAVDANVLIYERLREEQARGQSIRMALRNSYQKAFSAIFDSNLTTLITCVILGWVGTIEVRGFAITLALGVIISLFTALTVTRWIFQVMLDRKWLVRPLRMMPLFPVPKIDWMGKRWIFWVVSGSVTVLGIASIAWQGSEIWGIEFSSGSQVVLQFKDDALIGPRKELPNDELVRVLFSQEAAKQGLESLRDPRVELLIDPQKVQAYLGKYDTNKDGRVERAEAGGIPEAVFQKLDSDRTGVLDGQELQRNLPAYSYQVSSTETRLEAIEEVARRAFEGALAQRTKCTFQLAAGQVIPELGLATDAEGKARIELAETASLHRDVMEDYEGGVAVVVRDVTPPLTEADLKDRIREEREGRNEMLPTEVIGLGQRTEEGYRSFAILVKLDEVVAGRWASAASRQGEIVSDALNREETMIATVFDAAIAGMAAERAIVAVVLSWIGIVLYLWLRFGTARWGLAAVVCIIHDTLIVVGMVAASGWLYNTFLGRLLGMASFKIDLTMVAAILTIIGYSVNDTIVVFDRIRENRGKLTTVNVPLINLSVNQTLSRTLLTGTTTLLCVLIMYIWGGQGIQGFNFALLVGISFGTYSSIAIAAPLLLGFRGAFALRVADALAA